MKRWELAGIAALVTACTSTHAKPPTERPMMEAPRIRMAQAPFEVVAPISISFTPRRPTLADEEYACSIGSDLAYGATPRHDDIVADKHTSRLRVLKDTKMPAVLIEMLQVQNDESAQFYSHGCNAERIAQRIAQGIQEYWTLHPDLRAVVIDDGHGASPNIINEHIGISESDITRAVQKELARQLSPSGLSIYTLNHPGPEIPGNLRQARRRLDMYTDSANAIHRRERAVYISLHGNYLDWDPEGLRPPQMHITPYSSARTKQLARMIAEETNALFCAVWHENCAPERIATDAP